MEQVFRLVDADTTSLEARLGRALERGGPQCVVTRFTYWYTGRPPVHEAIVSRPQAASGTA
jgi:hypothetical protein